MEKTEGKIRYGLIGIGAQGGSYARFLTNAPAPFPGMVCAPCPDNCALGALCDIDPEKEKMCKEQYPDVPFFKDWKDMIASGTVEEGAEHSAQCTRTISTPLRRKIRMHFARHCFSF